jgi:hypothetical protein
VLVAVEVLAVSRWRRVLAVFGYGTGGRAQQTTTGPDDHAPGQPDEVRYTYIGGPVRRPIYQIVDPEWVDLSPATVNRPKP